MKRVFAIVAVLVAAPLVSVEVGCGDSGTGAGTSGIDCNATPPKGYSELGLAFAKCTSCHSSKLTDPTSRQAAPLGNDYDTYELATQWTADICASIEDGTMPPAGSATLTTTEENDLLAWCSCGAPQ